MTLHNCTALFHLCDAISKGKEDIRHRMWLYRIHQGPLFQAWLFKSESLTSTPAQGGEDHRGCECSIYCEESRADGRFIDGFGSSYQSIARCRYARDTVVIISFNLNTAHKKASHTILSKLRLSDTAMVILLVAR